MINWRQGGRTGSITRWVRREISEHIRNNAAFVRVRYGIFHRAIRIFFGSGRFGRFIFGYLLICLTFLVAEGVSGWLPPSWLPDWSISGPSPAVDIKALMLNISSYLLGAQIGLLGVISLSLALVTLIANDQDSSSDVRVYYHESFSLEIVASCIALAAVLCAQLLWPLHFLLHQVGLGTHHQIFKLGLLVIHLSWLLVNLGAVAHFISTTFRFVQQSPREQLRERYTANVVVPRDLRMRLREQIYGLASSELFETVDGAFENVHPTVAFGGFSQDDCREVELHSFFRKPVVLYDVRMIWVRWVLRRWSSRSIVANGVSSKPQTGGLGAQGPLIWFTPQIDTRIEGDVAWCRRRGGAEFSALEKLVLRSAFRFRSTRDEG